MKKYNLITQRDLNFWSKNKVNLLVGDWCLVGLDKKKYLKFKYKVNPYHWNKNKKKLNDLKYIKKIKSLFLKRFIGYLNQYHNINKPAKYWRILLYPWIDRWIQFIFDRWEIIKTIENKNINIIANFNKYNEKNFILNDSRSLIFLAHKEEWNEWIYNKIIEFRKSFQINYIKEKKFILELKIKKIFFNFGYYLNFFLTKLFFLKNKIIIQNTVFSRKIKLHLNLLFKQLNFFNFHINIRIFHR